MKFDSATRCLILLFLLHFVMLVGEQIHRSLVQRDPSTTRIDLWMIIFSSIHLLLSAMIWFHCNHRSSPPSNVHRRALPPFQPFQRYDLLELHRSTTTLMFTAILDEVRRFHRFTIVSSTGGDGEMSMYIEVIRPGRSLIIFVDYDHQRDQNTRFASNIRRLFISIFHHSNLLLTWGHLHLQLQGFLPFELFTDQHVREMFFIDVQQTFHEWYHRKKTAHMINVPNNTTNTYRTWSLSQAVAHCFDESLDEDRFDFHRCLAINQLSNFLRNTPSE